MEGWKVMMKYPDELKREALNLAAKPGMTVAQVERDLGDVTVESGHNPPQDRRTLFLPDVAFISKERAPAPDLARRTARPSIWTAN